MFAASTPNPAKLNPPIQYSYIWLVIGLLLLAIVICWYGYIFWSTRRKQLKSISNLKHLPAAVNIEKLKVIYLKLIADAYQRYQNKQLTPKELHNTLSMLIRDFAGEASHFPASRLTLSDLQRSQYPNLAKVIELYYPEEFSAITHGNAAASVDAAKGLVAQWPS